MNANDPWSRSILTPSPSFDSSGSDDDDKAPNVRKSAFTSVERDRDLLAELDLSRRDDRAVVKKTPFTMAKMNASRTIAQEVASRTRKENTKMGSSIMTAEDASKPSTGKVKPKPLAREKKTAQPSNGWTDGRGDPLPSSAPTQTKRGASSSSGARPAKAAKTPAAKKPTVTKKTGQKPAVKAKGKGKKTEDNIVFQRLPPDLSPSKEFPIVAGLERQKQLPFKPSPQKPTSIRASPSVYKQPRLDFKALVTGRTSSIDDSSRPKATITSPTASPSSSDTLDLRAALAAQGFKTGAKKKQGTFIPPKKVNEPKKVNDVYKSGREQAPQPTSVPGSSRLTPIPADNPSEKVLLPLDQNVNEELSGHESDHPNSNAGQPTTSTAPTGSERAQEPLLTRPVPIRPSVVSKLEALAEGGSRTAHDFSHSRPGQNFHKTHSQKHTKEDQPSYRRPAEPEPEADYSRRSSELHESHEQRTTTSRRLAVGPHYRSQSPIRCAGSLSPNQRGPELYLPQQTERKSEDEHGEDFWDNNAVGEPWGDYDERGLHSTQVQGYRATPNVPKGSTYRPRNGTAQPRSMNSEDDNAYEFDQEPTQYQERVEHQSSTSPGLRQDPTGPSVQPSGAHNRPGASGKGWQSVLQPQQPTTPDADWSTLSKRSRLTIAPSRYSSYSAPKSSGSFRMPLKQLNTPFAPSRLARSPARPTPPTTPAVKVSVWSPSKPRQTPTMHQPGTGYVPRHLRVLQQASSGSQPSDISTPARSRRNQPYPTPATTIRGYQPHALGSARQSSPSKPMPASDSSNDSDDWAAAWALPAKR